MISLSQKSSIILLQKLGKILKKSINLIDYQNTKSILMHIMKY